MATEFDGHANNAATTLNSDLSASQTSCIVRSPSSFPSPNFNATIWDAVTYPDPSDDPSMEIVKVTAGPATSTGWSITRAQESTTAVAHDSGSAIALLFTAKLLTDVEDAINSGSAPGHTHVTTELTDITSTYAELNILDGVTSTAAELNIMDGVTSDKDEINLLDGLTAVSGSDTVIVTGTAGTASDLSIWNGDGDLVDGPTPPSGTILGTTDTQTLTNKRITKRVTTITSHATPTVNTDNCDAVTITAQAEAITSMTTNLSGTPTNFQTLIYRILDNGTGRAISWGASFEAMGVALPTTTVANKVLTVGFIHDTVSSKWGCVASLSEA